MDLGYQDYVDFNVYDKNGNRFYSNCESLKEAEKLVKELESEGKKAIIGPKAVPRFKRTNSKYI